jgi:hypothetical protein
MPSYKKYLLAAHTLLILAMIVQDPHQAHRPPNFDAAHVAGVQMTAV